MKQIRILLTCTKTQKSTVFFQVDFLARQGLFDFSYLPGLSKLYAHKNGKNVNLCRYQWPSHGVDHQTTHRHDTGLFFLQKLVPETGAVDQFCILDKPPMEIPMEFATWSDGIHEVRP